MKKSGGRSSQVSHERKYPSAAVVNGDTQKREIFFVCGQTKNMRSADDGKRRDPHISGLRYFMRELQQKKARGVCQTQAPRAFFNRSPHPPAGLLPVPRNGQKHGHAGENHVTGISRSRETLIKYSSQCSCLLRQLHAFTQNTSANGFQFSSAISSANSVLSMYRHWSLSGTNP